MTTLYCWNAVATGDTPPTFCFGYISLKIQVTGDDELINQHPSLTVVLIGPINSQ